jgi:hypothetical protein
MDFETAGRLVELSLDLTKAGSTANEIFGKVLQLAADEIPSPTWETIGEVDLSGDIDATTAWLVDELVSNPPTNLSGLWFGLYEVQSPAGGTEAVIMVTGGPDFPDPEWLFNQDWEPDEYAPTPGLRSIIPLAESFDPDTQWLVSYAIVFAYVLALASGVCESPNRLQILGTHSRLAIAAGHHDGDIALMGVLRAEGLDRTEFGWT